MDLIDRYLAAVGVMLPSRQRADIAAELRDALITRREDREAETGRPLTEDEEVALLRGFGHPLAVAARYGRQQYLVGPELYPHYVFALKLVLGAIVLGAVAAGAAILAAGDGQPGPAIAAGLGVLWQGSISAVGVLTVVAAVLQRYNIRLKILDDWNPRDLPRPIKARRETGFDHVAAIVAHSLVALWWAHLLPFGIPYVTVIPLHGGQRLDLVLAPVWTTLYWPVLGLVLGSIALHGLKLMGKAQAKAAHGLAMVLHAAALGVALVALSAGDWIEASGAGLTAKALGEIHLGVNHAVHIALIVAAIAAAGLTAWDAVWLYRSGRRIGR